MKHFYILLFLLSFISTFAQEVSSPFSVAPYLQVGSNPSSTTMDILWQTSSNNPATFLLEYESSNGWQKIEVTAKNSSNIAPIGIRNFYIVHLENLEAGKNFKYIISLSGKIVFQSNANSLAKAGESYKLVVMGDIASGLEASALIAKQVMKESASLVLITGDIVYDRGLLHEYDQRFWPIYNGSKGASIMQSVPFVAAPGNHDVEERNFVRSPDALSYFQVWNQPLNGPDLKEGGASYPQIIASDSARAQFYSNAGARFPRMTNFSFDAGDVHWVFLDMDNYVDWTNDSLTNWLNHDLEITKQIWKIVVFHQPGFNSSIDHFEQQQSRLLSPIFEKNGVSVVFTGHVHNYQRTFPLTFKPDGKGYILNNNKTVGSRGRLVNGAWKLDKNFDGKTQTKMNGVLYIVTGAGGNDLYNPEQENDKDSWQPFTAKYIAREHSFTLAEINNKNIHLYQKNAKGEIIDEVTITK